MKSSFIIAAGSAIVGVLGLPSDTAGYSQQLAPRARVKLNQYKSLDDWYVYILFNYKFIKANSNTQ